MTAKNVSGDKAELNSPGYLRLFNVNLKQPLHEIVYYPLCGDTRAENDCFYSALTFVPKA